jgi:hypothetical protein
VHLDGAGRVVVVEARAESRGVELLFGRACLLDLLLNDRLEVLVEQLLGVGGAKAAISRGLTSRMTPMIRIAS